MALAKGTKLLLKNGQKAEIVAAFGNADCREYRVRVGHETRHFVETELLSELGATASTGGFRFDMQLDTPHVR